MIKGYRYILAVLTAAACLPMAAQEQTDSTEYKTTVLEEVVVEGRTRIITNEGMSIIPNKEDKKFSYDAYSLLQQIQMPNVRVQGESATTLSGEQVSFFIDFKPASESDVLSLRTKDVLRVEYMERPTDPRFLGNQNVVNFIMQQYEWGGYTALSAQQGFTQPQGNYRLTSKMKYKGSTIDLFARGHFQTDPRVGSYTKEQFNDVMFDGNRYDQIEKISDSHGHSKSRGFTGDFKITTNLNKEGSDYMVHGATIVYTRNPGSWSNSTVNYSPEITESSEAVSLSNGSNVSPRLFGNYYWNRGNNSYFVNWSGSYAFNKGNSSYSENYFPAIITDTREQSGTANINMYFSHQFSDGGYLSIVPALTGNWHFTDYKGSYSGKQRLFSTENLLLVTYQKQISKVYINSFIGISYSSWKVNHDASVSKWNPRFNAFMTWSPNSKHRLGAEFAWGNSSPQTQFNNDAMIQTEPLKWIQGNPDLKVTDMSTAYLQYVFMPTQKLIFVAHGQIDGFYHTPQFNWIQAPDGLNGVLRTLSPDGEYIKSFCMIQCSYYPTSSFNITGQGYYIYNRVRGINHESSDIFRCILYANYRVKNFGLSASVFSPVKSLDHSGFTTTKTPWAYDLSVTYSVNDFQAILSYGGSFEKRRRTQSYSNSKYYSYFTNSFTTGMKIALRLNYTFSYGKKVQRTENNVDENINSAVLQ